MRFYRIARKAKGHSPGEPPPELVDILLPAFAPCLGFQDTCKGHMRWDPAGGHAPRGFRGATGTVEEVELVLVCAEPGDPFPGESWAPPSGAPRDRLRMVYNASCNHLEQQVDKFARNLRFIIDMAWPELSFEEQMRKTWLTESVLCSARVEGGNVPHTVEKECGERYLLAQLALFPNARIVALGGKAQNRLARAGVPCESAPHPSTRGNLSEAREAWRQAVAGLEGSNRDKSISHTAVNQSPAPSKMVIQVPSPTSAAGWGLTFGSASGTDAMRVNCQLCDVPKTVAEICAATAHDRWGATPVGYRSAASHLKWHWDRNSGARPEPHNARTFVRGLMCPSPGWYCLPLSMKPNGNSTNRFR